MSIKIERQLPGKKYVVIEDYFEPIICVTVPKGFKCDHASIPRILWSIICPQDLSDVAPVIHDYLYAHAGIGIRVGSELKIYSKKEADYIFKIIMKRENVQTWKRRAAYFCVKYFAYFAWKRHLKKNKI